VFYELTQNMMEAQAMPAYEISNHARAGGEAKHNVHIWRGGSYLGIGPGAHGRMDASDGKRYATYNLRSPESWLSKPENGNEIFEEISIAQQQEEYLLMSLRLREGTALPQHHWRPEYLQALQGEGLIELTADRLIPTAAGRMVLNRLTEGLVEHLLV